MTRILKEMAPNTSDARLAYACLFRKFGSGVSSVDYDVGRLMVQGVLILGDAGFFELEY